MKIRVIASTFALVMGLHGIAPAVAGSFSDRGSDWAMDSPLPTSTHAGTPQALPPDGSFASSWGSGKTPSQYNGPSSSSTRLSAGRSCDLTPRVGFNQDNNFPVC